MNAAREEEKIKLNNLKKELYDQQTKMQQI